ncbi:hypothetical protein VA249_19240 [Vibrio alfacsensis]|uniref:DUF2513 domain-containing protein n=1 Tax=Vibrio alfacsensis TaxID=1074311 RepID=UPI001BEFEE10|nr:DUF2513 domain-containing protein [Vibrio alfacsensis]BBM65278.1 hypothetical protein VA249_19240 [Vibrio alfacsensis]
MKRDMELIRKLLMSIEELENPSSTAISIDGYEERVVNYHLYLLIQADLLNGNFDFEGGGNLSIPDYVRIYRVTWSGHEFIDNVRSEDVWNTLKSEFKEVSFSSLTNISKQLVEGFAKKKIESLLL